MDNNDQKKDISNLESKTSNFPNDYKILVKKLKSINKIVTLLETIFLDKER